VTLDKFISCKCDRDLAVLIVEGNPPDDILRYTWDDIYEAYTDGIADEKRKAYIRSVKEAAILEFKIQKVVAIQTYLSYAWNEEIANILKELGAADTKCPTGLTLRESWFKRVNGRVKRWALMLQEKRQSLEAMQKESGEAIKIDREYFDELIYCLEKRAQFHIDEKATTLARFITMVKDYQRYITQLQRKAA
jgi:hypothetical protein